MKKKYTTTAIMRDPGDEDEETKDQQGEALGEETTAPTEELGGEG